ncbi:50S ribosomal protein L13 chloroplastic [Zea mays]|uniref:50S ribosomal protein L13 chloroplastic n=1 Tax=Zea mays TaxID=4577 RepID=A0A1D6NC83_MAIZE|nr:50S ribosomal protein L13 chloroplastic [Zea mays]
MATAVASHTLLSSAFAPRHYHRRLTRTASVGPRRAAPVGLAVRCEKSDKQKRQPLAALVPREQRFMFEGDELCGPDIWNTTWYPKAADHVTTEKTCPFVTGASLKAHYHVNADKVAVSGKKRSQKLYRRHSGRPGGMKEETFDQLQKRIPERIIEHAVRGMLPKGRLGRRLFTHLKVYKGTEHPHEAQKPVPLPIRDKRIQKTG